MEMLRYKKGPEPEGLAIARSTPGADWDGPPSGFSRAKIREALLRDQDGLCAYCQRRIENYHRDRGGIIDPTDRSTRIEHWHARSAGGPPFVWANLLAVCTGLVEDQSHPDRVPPAPAPQVETCDRARGAQPLFLHPVEPTGPDPRAFLRYRGQGEIVADDGRATADVEILNLNASHLKRARMAALDSLVKHLGSDWGPARLRKLRERVRGTEYREAQWFMIDRWLRRGP